MLCLLFQIISIDVTINIFLDHAWQFLKHRWRGEYKDVFHEILRNCFYAIFIQFTWFKSAFKNLRVNKTIPCYGSNLAPKQFRICLILYRPNYIGTHVLSSRSLLASSPIIKVICTTMHVACFDSPVTSHKVLLKPGFTLQSINWILFIVERKLLPMLPVLTSHSAPGQWPREQKVCLTLGWSKVVIALCLLLERSDLYLGAVHILRQQL